MPRSICLIALGVVLMSSELYAQYNGTLTPGRYAVGYDVTGAASLRAPVSVWYPAARSAQVMTLGDYADASPQVFAVDGELPDAYRSAALLGLRGIATRKAARAAGRFPIVIIATGLRYESPLTQLVLAEQLASHGYMVLATPLVPVSGATMLYTDAELLAQVNDLKGLIAHASVLPYADSSRLALFGFDLGGMAAMLLAMERKDIDAFVGVDTGIAFPHNLPLIRALNAASPAGLHTPVLWITRSRAENDARGGEDHSLLRALGTPASILRIPRMRHHDFTIHGVIHGPFPNLWGPAPGTPHLGYETMVRAVTAFFDQHVGRDTTALRASKLVFESPTPASADPPRNVMHALYEASRAAQSGDGARALAMLEAAEQYAPAGSHVLHALAGAHARAGRTDLAAAYLARLARAGGSSALASDSVFTRLATNSAIRDALVHNAEAARPIIRGDTMRIVDVRDFIPEGIAYDAASRRYYLGSIAKRQIVAFRERGAIDTLVRDAGGEVYGVRVDPTRNRLWAAIRVVDASAPAGIFAGRGWAGLVSYDLGSGAERSRFVLRDTARAHFFNDITIADDGAVFITDTDGSALYRLNEKSGMAERFAAQAGLPYANGITADKDGAVLVGHVEGITRIDTRTGAASPLVAPDSVPIGIIDGLYRTGDTLIAIQSTRDFNRVIAMTLAPTHDRVMHVAVLEQRHPAHRIPTTGAIADGAFVYIANSELDRLDRNNTVAGPPSNAPVVLLRVPLPR